MSQTDTPSQDLYNTEKLGNHTKTKDEEEEEAELLLKQTSDEDVKQGEEKKRLRIYRKEELSAHYYSQSCWLVLADKVYDVTDFVNQHPAGDEIILEHAGHDATVAFIEVGHSKDAQQTLEQYCIGVLADSDCIIKK